MLKRCVLFGLTILISLIFSSINIYASTADYGFKTSELSADEIKQIWQSIDVRSLADLLSLNDIESSIVSFDVSDDGEILLGFEGNKFAVVDGTGVVNLYEFTNDGIFYVQWNGDNILLLLVRGSIVIEINSDGHLVNMIKADESSSENNSIWNYLSRRKCIRQGEYSYCIRNDMGLFNFFTSSYSQLIKTDSNGNTTVIYDISDTIIAKMIILLFCAVVLVAVIVKSVVMKSTKYINSHD